MRHSDLFLLLLTGISLTSFWCFSKPRCVLSLFPPLNHGLQHLRSCFFNWFTSSHICSFPPLVNSLQLTNQPPAHLCPVIFPGSGVCIILIGIYNYYCTQNFTDLTRSKYSVNDDSQWKYQSLDTSQDFRLFLITNSLDLKSKVFIFISLVHSMSTLKTWQENNSVKIIIVFTIGCMYVLGRPKKGISLGAFYSYGYWHPYCQHFLWVGCRNTYSRSVWGSIHARMYLVIVHPNSSCPNFISYLSYMSNPQKAGHKSLLSKFFWALLPI